MMGHVAQYFVGDDEWAALLGAAFEALGPGGLLAFEAREPAPARVAVVGHSAAPFRDSRRQFSVVVRTTRDQHECVRRHDHHHDGVIRSCPTAGT